MNSIQANPQSARHLAIYVHGKGGDSKEAEHYKPLLAGWDVTGFDYHAQNPWEAQAEFPVFFEEQRKAYDTILLIANSIGAFFSMHALSGRQVDQALLISPVVDMEKLIRSMMTWANVTEEELSARGEIPTSFGETLSWKYLGYVRRHPIRWDVPTCILYGDRDNLTAPGVMSAFAKRTSAVLTVMQGGEHWFHTAEQMAFLDRWVRTSLD